MFFGRPFRIFRTASFALALLYAALFASSAVVLGCIVYWTVQSSVDRQFKARIEGELRLLDLLAATEGASELVREVQQRAVYAGNLEYFLANSDGERLAGSLPDSPPKLGWSDIEVPDQQNPGHTKTFRVKTKLFDNGYRMTVGDDLAPIHEIRRAFLEALIWTLAAFLGLALLGGILLSTLFLRRVDAISKTVAEIIEGNLNSRVPLRGTYDPFDRLSASLNRMLDRIQLLMETLSQISNDIAHALRTPLSRLRHKLETARLSAERNSESNQTIDAALMETDTILDTFSALLRIAQIESGTRTAGFANIDLSNLFETVTDAFAMVAEEEGKTLTVNIAPMVIYWGDADLLSEMLANLIENAIKHTPEGTGIEVTLTNQNGVPVAAVADNGPGVPHQYRTRIFRRFYRLERSLAKPGNGLGLALVAAVAELHGIELVVADNRPGLRMTMSFIAHSPQRAEGRDFAGVSLTGAQEKSAPLQAHARLSISAPLLRPKPDVPYIVGNNASNAAREHVVNGINQAIYVRALTDQRRL
jgi:signal transduction histidine kinase